MRPFLIVTISPVSGTQNVMPSICSNGLQNSYLVQAALKTIGDEDKYFSRVTLRYNPLFFFSTA